MQEAKVGLLSRPAVDIKHKTLSKKTKVKNMASRRQRAAMLVDIL
jgi:hypothetical protein